MNNRNRNQLPFIGRPTRPGKRRRIHDIHAQTDDTAVGRVRVPEPTFDIQDVVAETLVDIVKECRSIHPVYGTPSYIAATHISPVPPVNTRPGVGRNFELKGVRCLGTMSMAQRAAMMLKNHFNRLPIRTGVYAHKGI